MSSGLSHSQLAPKTNHYMSLQAGINTKELSTYMDRTFQILHPDPSIIQRSRLHYQVAQKQILFEQHILASYFPKSPRHSTQRHASRSPMNQCSLRPQLPKSRSSRHFLIVLATASSPNGIHSVNHLGAFTSIESRSRARTWRDTLSWNTAFLAICWKQLLTTTIRVFFRSLRNPESAMILGPNLSLSTT